MGQVLIMASDYFYTTGPNAGQPKPGTRPEINDSPPSTDLPDGMPPRPDDYETVPYQYDPATDSWVSIL